MSNPQSILSSLPRDPDEQLRLGLRIIEAAYEEKTRYLDHELQQLRTYGKEQQHQVTTLERRVAELEGQLRESDERVRAVTDEKAALQQQLNATQRDLSKLDSFKRSILQSIKDEEPLGLGAGGSGGGYSSLDFTPGAGLGTRDTYTSVVPRSPATGSALPPSALGSAYGALPPQPPQATAPPPPSTPHDASAARMDGKDFFRQARLRLDYEQFNQFLTNIKKLNDHAQSRDETISKAQQIFGPDNEDLFNSFKVLLSKHGLA